MTTLSQTQVGDGPPPEVIRLGPRRVGGAPPPSRSSSTPFLGRRQAVHEAPLLRRAGLRPEEADMFFVPVYVRCSFSTPTRHPSLVHARGLLAEAVDLVRAKMPFWNRSSMAYHVSIPC